MILPRMLIAAMLALALGACQLGATAAPPIDAETEANPLVDLVVASAPTVLTIVNASGFDPLQIDAESLPVFGAVCEAARLGGGLLMPDSDLLNRHGKAGCDLILQALSARPVDPAQELTPPSASPSIEVPPEDAMPTS